MSARGVFAVDRDIWDDAEFPKEPFTEREAFLWLIGEAAWKAKKVRVGSATIELKRGQCAFSTRFMAAKWQWSEARVRRFLGRHKLPQSDLEKSAKIDAVSDARATLITITNYDRFQRVGLPSDAPYDAEATQERRTSDAKKKQGNIETDTPPIGGVAAQAGKQAAARASRLSEAWRPSEDDLANLAAHGVSLDSARKCFVRFQNHWIAQGGRNATKLDWGRAFRNWCLSDAEKGIIPLQPPTASTSADPRIEFGGGVSARLSVILDKFAQGRWYADWHGKPGESDCRIPREHWGKFQAKKALPEQQALFSEALH